MAKHPPCRICRSRKYHRDAVGAYVCESGHLLEHYRDEELEAYELGTGGRITFARRLKRIPKAQRNEIARLSPAEVRLRVVQGLQYILKLQCHALIDKHDFPKEILGVAKDIWILCLSSTTLNEVEGDEQKDTVKVEQSMGNEVKMGMDEEEEEEVQRVRMENQLWSKEDEDDEDEEQKEREDGYGSEEEEKTGELSSDYFGEKEEEEEEEEEKGSSWSSEESEEESWKTSGGRGWNDIRMEPPSETIRSYDPRIVAVGRVATEHPLFQELWAEEDNTEDEEEDQETSEGNGAIRERKWLERPLTLQLHTTLGVLLLAARWLRCPVLAVDILRWATEGSLPYLDAYTYLPPDLMEGMRWDQLPLFHPTTTPSCTRLRRVAMVIGDVLHHRHHVHVQVRLNEQALATRLVNMALLPDPFPSYAHELIRLYRQDWSDQEDRALKEGEVAAIVIVLGKWIYGLDGRDRNLSDPPYDQLPPLHQWLRAVQLEREEAGPKTLTHCSVQRLALTKPSTFLSLVNRSTFLLPSEKKVAGRASAKALYSTIRKLPLPPSRDRVIPRSATASPRFHRQIYHDKCSENEEGVPCPSSMESISQRHDSQMDQESTRPIRPGESYILPYSRRRQIWHPDYQTWLSLVGDMVGEDPYVLHSRVQRVEMALCFTSNR